VEHVYGPIRARPSLGWWLVAIHVAIRTSRGWRNFLLRDRKCCVTLADDQGKSPAYRLAGGHGRAEDLAFAWLRDAGTAGLACWRKQPTLQASPVNRGALMRFPPILRRGPAKTGGMDGCALSSQVHNSPTQSGPPLDWQGIRDRQHGTGGPRSWRSPSNIRTPVLGRVCVPR